MKYLESAIQKNIVNGVRSLYPKATIFSIPNEGKRNQRFAAILKASGMMHGVSDLICMNNSKIYFLEVKSEKGAQTQYQKEFEQKVKSHGFEYHVVRSTQDVINILNKQ